MEPTPSQISIVFIAGTVIMLLVFFYIFGFLLLYERKRQRYKSTIQKMEIENQKNLLAAVINAQENEKEYFAEELHDSIGQLLSTINLNLNTLKHNFEPIQGLHPNAKNTLNLTHEITRTAIQEVRNISQKLMPVILTDFGLHAALLDMAHKVNESGNINVILDNQVKEERLGAEVEKALFRITQELLNNTIKHAGATEVTILITCNNETTFYNYTDNGIGFEKMELTRASVGLKSIESRVNNIKGTLNIESAKKMGIKVKISLPKL
jgi:two-component system, NarL family, sensor kinase